MNTILFKVLENESIRTLGRGSNYSLFNSDWTINLKYVVVSLYHKVFNLYILL